MMEIARIKWTAYMKHRAKLRQFDLNKLEYIVRYSPERYYDVATKRFVVIGRHDRCLAIIPYETDNDTLIPITVHATTRQQITFRLKSGRFTHG